MPSEAQKPDSETLKLDAIQTENMAEWLLVVFLGHLRNRGIDQAASLALFEYFDQHDDDAGPTATEPFPVLSESRSKWKASATSAETSLSEANRRIEELEGALKSLTNTADGFSFREDAIRAIVGNTNWSVLRTHIDAARTALGAKEPK